MYVFFLFHHSLEFLQLTSDLCVSDSVDKRGRRVRQTSSEDLRKYYHLEGGWVSSLVTAILHLQPFVGLAILPREEEVESGTSILTPPPPPWMVILCSLVGHNLIYGGFSILLIYVATPYQQ